MRSPLGNIKFKFHIMKILLCFVILLAAKSTFGQDSTKVIGKWYVQEQGLFDEKTSSYSEMTFVLDSIPYSNRGLSIDCYSAWTFKKDSSFDWLIWCKSIYQDGPNFTTATDQTATWELINAETIVLKYFVSEKKRNAVYYSISYFEGKMKFTHIRNEKIKV